MKKIQLIALMIFGFSLFSIGTAQSNGLGIYTGYPTWLGVQTQSDNLRLGAGVSFAGIGAGADYMLGKAVMDAGNTSTDLSYYYGAGASAQANVFRDAGGFTLFPHVLAGLELGTPQNSMKYYGEVQLGFGFGLSGATSGLDFVGRFGLIFR